MFKIDRVKSIIVFILWLYMPNSALAEIVKVEPSSVETQPGETFEVAIVGEEFDVLTEGGGVSFSFNPNVVQVLDVQVDAPTWDFFSSSGTIDNESGMIHDIIFASFGGNIGSFPIATIQLETIDTGMSQLHPLASTLNPFSSNGQVLTVDFLPGQLQSAVPAPIPPSLLALLLPVLLGIAVRQPSLSWRFAS